MPGVKAQPRETAPLSPSWGWLTGTPRSGTSEDDTVDRPTAAVPPYPWGLLLRPLQIPCHLHKMALCTRRHGGLTVLFPCANFYSSQNGTFIINPILARLTSMTSWFCSFSSKASSEALLTHILIPPSGFYPIMGTDQGWPYVSTFAWDNLEQLQFVMVPASPLKSISI